MKLKFKIGTDAQYVEVKESSLISVLEPPHVDTAADEQGIIRYALDNPIASPKLGEIVKPGEKIAIVTSDITRPMPTWS